MGLISFDQVRQNEGNHRVTNQSAEDKRASSEPQATKNLEQITKRELRALAEKRGIDLSEVADRKTDLIAAIREGRA